MPTDATNLESTALGKPTQLKSQSGSTASTGNKVPVPYIAGGISPKNPMHYRQQGYRWQQHRIHAVASGEGADSVVTSSAVTTPSIFTETDPSFVASRSGGRTEDELIAIVKNALAYRNGIGLNPDTLASDFKFEGPVVGPLGRDAFVNALGNVDFAAAFPDWKGQFYGFHVDPIDGNRVWYIARGEGTNKGPFPGPLSATGKRVVNPPQSCSMTINSEGLISRYTIGYVIDRNAGNTGGLGGLYGILYAIGRGLPFPEAQPWSPSPPYVAFQTIGQVLGGLAANSNSGSK
jgi:hypothetical protein